MSQDGDRCPAWKIGIDFFAVCVLALALITALFNGTPHDFMVDDDRYDREISKAANDHDLDPLFVKALIFIESRFNQFARGSSGEIGLMQVLPDTAAADWAWRFHRSKPSIAELLDIETNLDIGCWYLAQGMAEYKGYRHREELALARYNAGPRASRWKPEKRDGKVICRITNPVTKSYVKRIMLKYNEYTGRKLAARGK